MTAAINWCTVRFFKRNVRQFFKAMSEKLFTYHSCLSWSVEQLQRLEANRYRLQRVCR